MDVEDEQNSYLKYLNDSETPNTYLLGNNEVGLFSVEPIFNDMEGTDWPQEGFPLLLTNSLITEEECPNKNIDGLTRADRTSPNDADFTEYKVDEALHDTNGLETQNRDLLPENNLNLCENVLEVQDNMPSDQQDTQLLNDNAIQIDSAAHLHNTNYILIKSNDNQTSGTVTELVNDKGNAITTRSSIVTSNILPAGQKQLVLATQNKPKSVTNLFSTVVANKCKICGFLCEDLGQIKNHINMTHPEYIFTQNGLSNGVSVLLANAKQKEKENNKEFVIYVCSECQGVSTDKSDLKNHMIQMHGLAMNLEPETKAVEPRLEEKPVKKLSSYLDDTNLSLIKKQERTLQKVKCTVKGCAATFPSEQLRKAHVELHIGNTKSMFKCSECDKKLMLWTLTRNHMYNEHSIDFGMITCPMCNNFKSYRTVRVLKHMLIHSNVKPFLCSECGKSFKQLPQLKNHELTHKLPEDMPLWAKVKKCDKCERFFANSKCLKVHIKTVHENIKPFICSICGHKTSRKAMLELHMRQHTASKPFKCDYCTFRTGDQNSLRKHTMGHLGITSYQCPYCPYSCIQAGSIKSHFIRRHKDKTGVYYCKSCSYSTINETFLSAHEKTHNSTSKGSKVTDNEAVSETTTIRQAALQAEEETQNCFLNGDSQIEETVDNGGITIPAGLKMPMDT